MNSTRSENKNQKQNESENKNQNESENQNQNENERIDHRKIKRALWRTTINEDGTTTYNNKPLDPHYHRNYWHAKRKIILQSKINCDICGSIVSKAHLTRHKKTAIKCAKLQNENMTKLLQ